MSLGPKSRRVAGPAVARPPPNQSSTPECLLTEMRPQASRAFRDLSSCCESPPVPEAVPFLQNAFSQQSPDLDASDLENGILSGDKGPKVSHTCADSDDNYAITPNVYSLPSRSKWTWRWRIQFLYRTLFGRRRKSLAISNEKARRQPIRRKPSTLRTRPSTYWTPADAPVSASSYLPRCCTD